mmetsp:Transcript_35697/g.83558  ORF Transcript_35697/g.83558 Transcript_35697/m.83558 type:complete len:318 (-) Transcript_35697:35-988(-)
MDETRKLLDSLMGNARNASLEEAKKMKGKTFTQDNVCKFHLLGFCPTHELASSKLAVKRNIKDCTKVHSDAMKAEFEAHADMEKFKAEYERALLPVLEGYVKEADAWVNRERANVQKNTTETDKKATEIPPDVKANLDQLNNDLNKLMAAAEQCAESGDIEGSKFKVTLADEIKTKIKEIEDQHTWEVKVREEEVCEVCGTRFEALAQKNQARFKAHFTGKVHMAYVKIREWIKELKAKKGEGEARPAKADGDRGPRKRSRSKEERGGGRDRERERGRERGRRSRSRDDRGRRSRSRDDRRQRSRSRGRRRRSRSRQ